MDISQFTDNASCRVTCKKSSPLICLKRLLPRHTKGIEMTSICGWFAFIVYLCLSSPDDDMYIHLLEILHPVLWGVGTGLLALVHLVCILSHPETGFIGRFFCTLVSLFLTLFIVVLELVIGSRDFVIFMFGLLAGLTWAVFRLGMSK